MISCDLLVEALLGMFELAPTAICISTADLNDGRYLRVNQAYLGLVGRTWRTCETSV